MTRTAADIQAEIDRLRPFQKESVPCAARINRLQRELDLTRVGELLQAARAEASEALLEAGNAARDAHAAGMPETIIAERVGVNRRTVRRWLGKD